MLTIIEKEMPKLWISPQSRFNSCLYPNSAKMPSSASSTASEVLLALEALLSIGWLIADAGATLLSAMTPCQLQHQYQPRLRKCECNYCNHGSKGGKSGALIQLAVSAKLL
jgi:hypothetical protein